MDDLSHYSVIERLRDGRTLEIRALLPGDRVGVLAAIDHSSAQSLYRRLFLGRSAASPTRRLCSCLRWTSLTT
ncbi:hypothetical protein [Methylorubrum extorquens]|uniref:hypothetical protein n=1 Tax=Methylorubrum extorquens TaxID=408 RepID=UPI000A5A939E|nr:MULTISPECIES: hypothetical protein [Methylobacteriaceae]UYW35271.1 hypothetical protein OKB92_03350 [Methylorubrum extorquens]